MDYIPAKDALFANWLVNFSTLITADPTAYGLVAADAVIIAAEETAFTAAYALAVDPGTRTAPTIAAKDAARISAEAVCRPYANRINVNPAVTNMQRLDLGLTVRKTTKTPVPAPTAWPVLTAQPAGVGAAVIGFSSNETPASKAKPPGVTGVHYQVFREDPGPVEVLVGDGSAGKSPFHIATDPADAGAKHIVRATFRTTSGPDGLAQDGPAGPDVSFYAQ